jgi:hypothetical protein
LLYLGLHPVGMGPEALGPGHPQKGPLLGQGLQVGGLVGLKKLQALLGLGQAQLAQGAFGEEAEAEVKLAFADDLLPHLGHHGVLLGQGGKA